MCNKGCILHPSLIGYQSAPNLKASAFDREKILLAFQQLSISQKPDCKSDEPQGYSCDCFVYALGTVLASGNLVRSLLKEGSMETIPTPPSGGDKYDKASVFEELPTIHDSEFPDWRPNVDIGETASHYVIVIELAGVKREDLALTYDNGALTIEAEAPASQHRDWNYFIREERVKGHCRRTFTLPTNVNVVDRRETYADGLLRIWISKQGDITVIPETQDTMTAGAERPIKPLPDEPPTDEPTTIAPTG